jgi:hypothetical protein
MKKWTKPIIITVIIIIFLIPIIIITNYVGVGILFTNIINKIAEQTGINKYIINIFIVLLIIPFIKSVLNLFSLKKEKRRSGLIFLIIFFVVYNFSLYLLTKDIYFNYSNGSSLKWYALTPEGVKYYDGPGTDPIYGIKLRPVTPEIIKNLKLLTSSNFIPVDPTTAQLFNPITGESKLWYYKHHDGAYDFFDKPGYHPINGEELKPVTKEVYNEWKNQIEQKKAHEIQQNNLTRVSNEINKFNSTINYEKNLPDENGKIILFIKIDDPTNNISNKFTNKVVTNKRILKNYFNYSFVSDGYFEKIFNGETSTVNESRVFKDGKYLVLGEIEYSFRNNNQVVKDIISCDINLSYKIYQKNGLLISDNMSAIGPGFSKENSLDEAIKILAEKYSKKLTNIL